MLRWMSVVTRKDRLGNKYIKRKSTGGPIGREIQGMPFEMV